MRQITLVIISLQCENGFNKDIHQFLRDILVTLNFFRIMQIELANLVVDLLVEDVFPERHLLPDGVTLDVLRHVRIVAHPTEILKDTNRQWSRSLEC